MLLRIDPASGSPIFDQLAASVRAEVARGALRAGDRLPSAREVAASLEVNIHTVLRAYQELRDEGVIELRRGRGAIVSERAASSDRLLRAVRELAAEARRLDLGYATVTALLREELDS